MDEYIKREDVLRHKDKMMGCDWGGDFWNDAVLCSEIEKIPAADVAKVRRGKWIYHDTDENDMVIIKCSECNTKRYGRSNYCSKCGAKMNGKDNNVTTKIDIVEVIRCQYCQYGRPIDITKSPEKYYRDDCIVCECEDVVGEEPMIYQPDHFCRCGKRREKELHLKG